MKICFLIFIASLTVVVQASGQEVSIDSVRQLNEVVIEAFNYNRPLMEVPASIGVLGQKELERYNPASMVSAVNSIAGVRMEERSPGSYRLSIRGSTLRSPFGVRNVKVYWNDLPFTDPGGNTYLNLFDVSTLDQIEISKGPGASLYGAGTGGVVLLKNFSIKQKSNVETSALAGSFGLLRYTARLRIHSDKTDVQLVYAHQQANGYRDQSKMARDVLQGEINFGGTDRSTISLNFLYADLFYQTPGGLTKQQFDDDPSQARPAGGPNPGATEQHAAIYNKTFYSGVSHSFRWNDKWDSKTGVYGSFTQFENPAILNYEKKTEQSVGGRTTTQYQFEKGKVSFGGEFQHGFIPVTVYANNLGQVGALQNDDEISTTTYFVFAQSEFYLPSQFFLTVGGSLNKLKVAFTRLSATPQVNEERDFDFVFSPRVALLKKIDQQLSAYATFSQGYSPPTVAELYPSTSVFNQQLNPELGNNFELGFRGNAINKQFTFDVAAYYFNLNQTIVIRRNESGQEYFVNAGSTVQKGLELQLTWTPKLAEQSVLNDFKIWASGTFNKYRFQEYMRDTLNFAGNKLTGVPPCVLVTGMDLSFDMGLYTRITFSHTGTIQFKEEEAIPLNDENTEYANGYNLLGGQVGYRKTWQKINLDFFIGVDNALNENYSLGNDLNARGGRYYNAAPTINFYSGVKIGFTK